MTELGAKLTELGRILQHLRKPDEREEAIVEAAQACGVEMVYRNRYRCSVCNSTFEAVMVKPTWFGRCTSCGRMQYPIGSERVVR